MKKEIIQFSKYFILGLVGLIILFINSKIKHVELPAPGEYYYSNFLRSNYSYFSGSLFFLTGFLVGYYYKLNPWISGISLISVYPITALIESTIYRGSHNLIPFELIVHFLFSLPGVMGVYLSRFFTKK